MYGNDYMCPKRCLEIPAWVFAYDLATLSGFKPVRDLTREHILSASAEERFGDDGDSNDDNDEEDIGEETDIFYWYSRSDPASSFNTFYDDMPLTGWWPWPRQEMEDGDATEEGTEDLGLEFKTYLD
ncbi:hypothetical protein Micbo1qcDRAFT_177086 [Microdochium bolleyi]|uniref:Uncharacterized protein n=1 Tax=Microdochium bolleyi TaxID=196109 RepID=A0A136IYE0_9PEZI|nr:hypothetical protein Micbo1qcDRAFT_177086 [Microdochium bolleyi]